MNLFVAYCLAVVIINIKCDTFTASLSSSLTLVSSVAYVFNFTFGSRTIPASSAATLSLSLNFNLNSSSVANCMYATTASSSYSSTTCTVSTNSSGNYIQFASIYANQLTSETLLSLKLQMSNPWGAGSENINIVIIDSGGSNLTLKQTLSIPYSASPLNSCQWTSNSTVNGASSSRTISFIPSVQLIQTSYLQVTIPLWFSTTSNVIGATLSCSNVSNIDFAPICSYTTIGSNEVYTFSNLFSSNKSVSSTVALSMQNLYNPWSLYSFSPITYQLYNTQNGATKLTQSCSGLSQTTTTLNTFSLLSISANFATISGIGNSKVIQFTTKNPIPQSGGQLKLSWSGGVTVSYTTQTNVIVVSQTSNQIIISNFSSTDILSSTTKFLFGWNFVNPPSSRQFTISLTSMYSIGGSTYGIDSQTNSYSCNSGNISTYSLSSTSYAINAVAAHTITFTTVYALTSGSYIGIYFPNYITLVLGSSCSSTNGLLACTVSNTSYANISISGAIPAATSLSIKFNSVNNPNQAFTTGSFSIYTYYDSGLDSLVDKLISGMTFTAVANQLTSNVYVVPSNNVTYTLANYIFSIQLTDKILAGGSIAITVPTAVTLNSVGIVSSSFSTSTCVLSVSGNSINLTSCFATDYTNLAITFTLSGFTNPNSFQPTSSFAISTSGTLGIINYINSGLPVTMNSASTSTSFSITPQVQTVHTFSAYNVSMTFFTSHIASDYMLLTIPSSMQLAASPTCPASQGIAIIGCSVVNATTLKLTMTTLPSAYIQFTINSIRNYDVSSTSISFQVYVYNSANYLMEISPTSAVSYTVGAITTYSVNSNNQIVLNHASNISITLSAPFSIDSSFSSALTSLVLTLPIQFSSLGNTSCTSTVGTSCTLLNSTSFKVAAAGISVTGATISLINIKLPYIVGTSTSFSIQYLYNSLQIAVVNSGVVVSPYCDSPCQQCSTSPTVCLSCLPSPNLYTLYYSTNNSCVNVCPSGTYINSSNCSSCVLPCSTCTTSTICVTCTNGTVFYASNSSCLSSCPSGYYNDSNGNCSLCVSPCSTCLSITTCLSCSTNYYSNYSCVNASSCPSGTYGNATDHTCDACQSPCLTCLQSQSNCTSCINSTVFYNNFCLGSCPPTMYSNSTICVSCISPCSNCTSSSYCLSCISTYLFNGTCYASTMCPAGTFANSTSLTCDSCAINCSTCFLASTNCTSCNSPYFYYSGTCVNSCPSGMFQNGTLCVACISPCLTCSSATSCLSCSINFYTNYSCVIDSLCPVGTFANLTSLNCDTCSINCSTCSLLPTNCTSCRSPYFYYNGSCVNSCPNGMFQNGTVCEICTSPCLTCSSITICLSCSTNFYTNHSCVNASQCPAGTFANTTSFNCDSCSINCSTCYLLPTNCTSCSSPYFYYNGSCVNSCPSGMYQNSSVCLSCSSPCLTCTSATVCLSCSTNYYTNYSCVNASQCPAGTFANLTSLNCDVCSLNCSTCSSIAANCTTCTSPYYFYNATCVNSCPSGMYPSGTVCLTCISPCLTCSNATICLSCSTNYFSNFSCVNASSCPMGTFANLTSNNCDACSVNCSTCAISPSICTSCSSPYFFYNGSCVNSCPSGMFQNGTVCQACISPCLTCTSATTCLSCSIKFYSNFSCVDASLCPIGTFANLTSLNCDSCSANCTTCSSIATNCTSCIAPYSYYNGTCQSFCPSMMFKNATVCSSCILPCLTCTTQTACLSCSASYYTNFSCVAAAQCPAGTFANATSLTCDSCSINCSTCFSLPINCTSCRTPYFYYNGSCVSSCPNGMFQNGTVCQTCISPCLTCTSATVCLSCSTNFYTNYSCVNASQCPAGTFANLTSLNCDVCSLNCSTCSSNATTCSSCILPHYFYNASCVDSCPIGMYPSGTVCQSCVSPCLTCSSVTICLSCSTNYYSNYSCVNASQCPLGTFANLTSLNCDACSSICTTCSLSSSNCTSCTSPYVYYNFQCINSCPNTTFQNNTKCAACSLPCNFCTNAVVCLNCAAGYYYFNQTCLSSNLCPNGTFANSSNLNCSACLSPCVNCFGNQNNCTSCIGSLVYDNNQCISTCPNQMYNSTGNCLNCTYPCGNCSSSTLCLSCLGGYLTNGSCVTSAGCPNGTYAESVNNTCSSCQPQCTSCSTASNCTTCSTSYNYYNYTCISNCPSGTYSQNFICTNCSSTCLTCTSSASNCTTCPSNLNYFKYTCLGGCPAGTYNLSLSCVSCSSACQTCSNYSLCTSCNGSLFLSNSQCQSTCPSGTYTDYSANACQNCSSTCLTCSNSQSNCTTCPSNLLFSSFSCQLSCPANYFNISGICTTCPNCNSCTNATNCFICSNGLYLYLGVCYSSCPPVAPIPNNITYTCSLCGSSCSSCNSDGSYCFTCSTGYLMLTGQCYLSCPSGYTSDSSSTKCTAVKSPSTAYFPFTISFFCISLIAIFSKFKYNHSDLIGNVTSLFALGFLFSIVVFAFSTYTNNVSSRLLQSSSIDSNALTLLFGGGIAVVSILLIIGIFFNIYIYKKLQNDPGLVLWKKNTKINRFMFNLISILSCFHFAIFRFIYSKIFLKECFSCYIKAHKHLLFVTNILTFIAILFTNIPSISFSIYIIIKQQGDTQTQILAIDNLIMSVVLAILLLLDMGSRKPQDFQNILQDFPYLKKTKKYQDLDSSSGSLISIHQSEEEHHYKTEVDPKEKNKLDQVNIDDQLGNFGAISQIENVENSKIITKTLPQFNQMTGQIGFNPFELKRANDDLFFQQKQYTKKFNEIKEQYTKGIFEEEVFDDQGVTHQNQDLYREKINIEQIINQKKKEVDPQQFLDKFRSQDYDNLSKQEMAILMEMAEQKGLDPAFIKQTFGKNKYYNRKILEEIIGDHEQISKESAQELFNDANSQSKLREILGQKSNINTDKLIDILNDPHFREIIEAMFNKQTGFLSVQAIKDLLADNKKYSKDFIIRLLNNQMIDKNRLRMLIESNKEGELDSLKTIKQLGGENLQNGQRISNMLGRESPLNPTLIPKIKKEMSEKSTSNIFDKKSPSSNVMIKRIINNKRINLDELNPIQEMPEIIQEFAELLTCGNEDLQESLIEVLQTNNFDGERLKELIKNSGNSQEEMAKLLQYIKQNKQNSKMREETPVEEWSEGDQQEIEDQRQSSLPSLNFSVNEDQQQIQKKQIFNPYAQENDESLIEPFDPSSKLRRRTRYKKQEPKPIHLPSQQIYLQRLQAPHEAQRNKKFRKAKKKTTKTPNKFMDEDNEVYDLDF